MRAGIDPRPGEHLPLRDRFAAAGPAHNRPEIARNTQLALRLSELAREHGLHELFHDRLMDAHWSEATNIGAPQDVRRLAPDVTRRQTRSGSTRSRPSFSTVG